MKRITLLTLLLLAATGMVMQSGSIPHAHAVGAPGVYNEEHDLTLLAGLAGHVIPVDATPSITLEPVSVPLSSYVPERPILYTALSGDSRAPPVR
jgi:hypothetical protein